MQGIEYMLKPTVDAGRSHNKGHPRERRQHGARDRTHTRFWPGFRRRARRFWRTRRGRPHRDVEAVVDCELPCADRICEPEHQQ